MPKSYAFEQAERRRRLGLPLESPRASAAVITPTKVEMPFYIVTYILRAKPPSTFVTYILTAGETC
jgi:hypothetical protein